MRRRLAAAATLMLAFALAGASPPDRFDPWKPAPKSRAEEPALNVPRALRLPGVRHWHYILRGVPKAYVDARSTIARSPQAIATGGLLYGRHCASCHGATGLGAQVTAQSLLPSPPLLAFLIQKPIAVDEYLLWSISDGGRQFDSGMPAFKETLSREDIWAIIAFMRTGFPETGK